MRLSTWNCRQRIDSKRAALRAIGADVLVLQECSARPALALEPGVSYLWQGENPHKGLAVLGFEGWRVERRRAPVELPWVLPVDVFDAVGVRTFSLLAVWTLTPRAGRPRYAGQVAQLLDAWAGALAEGGTVVAGDLNCSLQGPSRRPHGANLDRLADLGVTSAYHSWNASAHGDETEMTLRWVGPGRVRRGYHCDFIFLPGTMLERLKDVRVGPAAEWLDSGHSDHCPVSVDLRCDAD